ncbi:MAG: hypothetical protein PHV18_09980 [Lachnospiraceae bacterium]|nr:hypothetical protein [Lachnospiraceae bacterium]
MKLKRMAAVTLGMILAFSTTAYANDADAVAVYQEMEAVSKTTTDMDCYYDFATKVDDGETPINARLEMNMKGNHLTDPAQIRFNNYMRMTMAMPGAFEPGEEAQDLVLTGSTYYENGMYYIDMMGNKTKTEAPLAEVMETIQSATGFTGTSLEYIQNLKLRTEGTDRILTFTMDAAKMNELLGQLMGMNAMSELTKNTASVSYRDLSGEYIIDQRGYCTKAKLKMTMDMAIEDQSITMELDGDIGYANPGQPVEFATPNLAEYVKVE